MKGHMAHLQEIINCSQRIQFSAVIYSTPIVQLNLNSINKKRLMSFHAHQSFPGPVFNFNSHATKLQHEYLFKVITTPILEFWGASVVC